MKSDLRSYVMLAIVTILLVANVGLYFQFKQLEDQVHRLTQFFQPPETLEVGEMAPDFELVDFAGQRISLKDYAGLPVLLIFSSVSCPACQEFWPHLLSFSTENTSLTMLMISKGRWQRILILPKVKDLNFLCFNGMMQLLKLTRYLEHLI